jgi:hypothetical protein
MHLQYLQKDMYIPDDVTFLIDSIQEKQINPWISNLPTCHHHYKTHSGHAKEQSLF